MEEINGRIVKLEGGLYTVLADNGKNIMCRAKGAFRKSHLSPLVGDCVCCSLSQGSEAVISEVLPRKNSLIRPNAANIDILAVVTAPAEPSPDCYVLDKLCAVAQHNNIETVFIINKSDIASAEKLESIYRLAGFKVFVISAIAEVSSSSDAKELREYFRGKTVFFTGASGVGKSSTIKMLYPELNPRTGELSKKISRGKNTTRCTELYSASGDTFIGDTPGFTMLEVASLKLIPKEELIYAFPDIEKYSHQCRYRDCTHLSEEECSVMEALKKKQISPSRHESFKKLTEEIKKESEY